MLTKEESIRFKSYLNNDDCPYTGNYLHSIINEFTEKPKREIKVGDIYKNEHGKFVHIYEYRFHPDDENYCFLGYVSAAPTEKGHTCWFNKDGGGKGFDRGNDLDLSKRYEIVEVNDNE